MVLKREIRSLNLIHRFSDSLIGLSPYYSYFIRNEMHTNIGDVSLCRLISDVPGKFREKIGARDVELEDCRDRDSTEMRVQFVAWLLVYALGTFDC